MNTLKPIAVALIAGICFVLSVTIASNGLIASKKNSANGGITVTGSASRNFTSDLIAWGGNFSAHANTTKEAYAILKNDADIVNKYLLNAGVNEDEIVFSSIDIREDSYNEYFENGNIKSTVFNGYTLTQNVKIESPEVDKIEKVSRDITQLIDTGVQFYSYSPEYYYTKLDELKLEMISQATDNARKRAELVTENSKSSIGKLISANLGVFQITAQNSSADDYSDGGAFNTWSKNKTASVTVKLYYDVK